MNPIVPIIAIPTAETFAVSSNSFIEGFFRVLQTLLHLSKKDFDDSVIDMILIEMNHLKIFSFQKINCLL